MTFIYEIVLVRHPNGEKDESFQILILSEMSCIADFGIMMFYAVIIYIFSVQKTIDEDKPLALLSRKLRHNIITG